MNSVKENKDSLLFDEPMTSKRLGIEYSTLKLLRKGGLISDVRIGQRIFYRLSDIENFISRREVEVAGQYKQNFEIIIASPENSMEVMLFLEVVKL